MSGCIDVFLTTIGACMQPSPTRLTPARSSRLHTAARLLPLQPSPLAAGFLAAPVMRHDEAAYRSAAAHHHHKDKIPMHHHTHSHAVPSHNKHIAHMHPYQPPHDVLRPITNQYSSAGQYYTVRETTHHRSAAGSSTVGERSLGSHYQQPPLQQKNVYTASKENIPISRPAEMSDRQLLALRFARKGISLEQTTKIGSGRYSKVLTAHIKKNGIKIAIKMINTQKVTEEFRSKFLPREIECWEQLQHSNLVQLLGKDEALSRVFLFMEFGPGGDLLQFVQKNGPIREKTASLWIRQVISGLYYMHRLGVVHRDLKLENIIIFNMHTVKISDFGFARKIGAELSTTYCGSKSYSAPEILSGQPYSPYKADVWSLGVIAYVIVTDRMPFKDSMANTQIVDAQRRRLYTYPANLDLSEACRTTIDTMLTFDWHGRPTVADASRMSWFAGMF